MADQVPNEPPPAYTRRDDQNKPTNNASNRLSVPNADQGEGSSSPRLRRSMEDRVRELPEGWIRQFDAESAHHFYVDTRAKPPRSIWTHPYDDEEYMNSLNDRERERIRNDQVVHDGTDLEDEDDSNAAGKGKGKEGEKKTFGRKLKDKMTGKTHEEREEERKRRAERERRAMETHMHIQRCLEQAARTGQPVLVGRDQRGEEVWAQPPPRGPYGPGYGGYGGGMYGRPVGPYRRGGYGAGPGMAYGGLAALTGGMLLGGLLF